MQHSAGDENGGDDGNWEPEPFVVAIEDAIDLHRFAPREVIEVVDAYLDAALEIGLREVRLIHGRGKGVQRARVQSYLDHDARVERWQEAPPDRGGWGATIAWLRRAAGSLRADGHTMSSITDAALRRELGRLEKQRGKPFPSRRGALPRGPAPRGG